MDTRSVLWRCSCPHCTTEVAGEGEEKSSGKLFWGQKPVIQQMQRFFCSDVFFLLQGQQVEAVHLKIIYWQYFSLGQRKGLRLLHPHSQQLTQLHF